VLKNQSKQLLLKFLHKSSFLRHFVASQRNKVTILMLHGVIDPNTQAVWTPLRSQLSAEQLTRALSVLASYYNFVSLSEATEMLAGTRPLTSNSMVLTFDDGYRNNLTTALPILHRFKAPATFFLCTGNVSKQVPFWFDRLDYAIQSISQETIPHQKFPELKDIDFSNRNTLKKTFISFIRKEKQRYPSNANMRSTMASLTERLEQYSGRGLAEIFANDPWSGILSWNEIRKATTLGVHFGSHGVDHPLLGLAPLSIINEELVESQKMIEYHTGCPCTQLAYPAGSFNQDVISLAKTCNYTSAVTIIPGLNQRGDEALALRRIAFPHGGTPAEIIFAASGLSYHRQKFNGLLS